MLGHYYGDHDDHYCYCHLLNCSSTDVHRTAALKTKIRNVTFPCERRLASLLPGVVAVDDFRVAGLADRRSCMAPGTGSLSLPGEGLLLPGDLLLLPGVAALSPPGDLLLLPGISDLSPAGDRLPLRLSRAISASCWAAELSPAPLRNRSIRLAVIIKGR